MQAQPVAGLVWAVGGHVAQVLGGARVDRALEDVAAGPVVAHQDLQGVKGAVG